MRTARVFTNGNSQAVRLPKAFRLGVRQVFIRKDPATGDLVLSTRPAHAGWEEFFALRAKTRLPAGFLAERPLNAPGAMRDPFAARVRGRRAR